MAKPSVSWCLQTQFFSQNLSCNLQNAKNCFPGQLKYNCSRLGQLKTHHSTLTSCASFFISMTLQQLNTQLTKYVFGHFSWWPKHELLDLTLNFSTSTPSLWLDTKRLAWSGLRVVSLISCTTKITKLRNRPEFSYRYYTPPTCLSVNSNRRLVAYSKDISDVAYCY